MVGKSGRNRNNSRKRRYNRNMHSHKRTAAWETPCSKTSGCSLTQASTFERVRSLTPLIPDMLRSSFLLAEAAMELTSEHTSLEVRTFEGANKRQSQRCELCGSWLGAGDADHVGVPMAVATASWVETASTRWGGLAVDTARRLEPRANT